MMKNANPPTPAIFFTAALAIVALFFVLNQPSSDLPFCSSDEKQLIVCVRSWLNSAGNLLGLVVAVFAATYAFRQAKAANKQASAALYDVLRERGSQVSKAHRLSDKMISQHYRLIILLKRMDQYLTAGAVDDTLVKLALEVSNTQDRLTDKRNKLRRYGRNINLFTDIESVVRKIVNDGFELAMNDCGIALRSVRDAGMASRTQQSAEVLSRLRGDQHYVKRSIYYLEQKQIKLGLELKALEIQGAAANDRLLKLLGLSVGT